MKKCATCGSVKMKAGGAKKMGMGGMHMMPDGSMMKDSMMKSGGSKSSFGMLSVKAGIDKNPKATAADRIAGAKMKAGKAKHGGAKK